MRLSAHRLIVSSLISAALLFAYLTLFRGPTDISPPFSLPNFSPDSKKNGVASLRPPLEALNADVNATFLNAARHFWRPWARVISDAKPSVAAIDLVGNSAGNIGVAEDSNGFREPFMDLLALEEHNVKELTASHAKIRAALDAGTGTLEQDVERLFEGRGIVTVAGGEYFGPAIVGIRMLRQSGSDLPVEAFLANWEEYEPALCEKVLPDLNARCVVLTQLLEPPKEDEIGEAAKDHQDLNFSITHYQLKSLALLFSSFQEVLLVDSDSIPLVNPEELFSTEPFLSTGFVGWPDFWIGTEAPVFYQIAGLNEFPKELPAASSEAGQLLVDKRKHIKTLLLATYYNIWGPGYFYPLLSQGALGQGDKNTFETAAIVLGAPYYRLKTPVKSLGRQTGHEFKGSGMVQFHPADDYEKFFRAMEVSGNKTVRAAFMHANTPKMNPGHLVDEGDLQDMVSKKHLRLWGSLEDQQSIFGADLEKSTIQVVVDVGCELANVVKEWKHRWRICSKLKSHFKATFE